jgi:hypothetical protein
VLLSKPRFSELTAFGIPAQMQVRQFSKAGVVVDWVVKAREHGATAVEHTVAKKLPRTVLSIV